jgi:hypothetical protein
MIAALAIKPDYHEALVQQRQYVSSYLGRYEEAIASL